MLMVTFIIGDYRGVSSHPRASFNSPFLDKRGLASCALIFPCLFL